jgi:hypothetical protein
MRRLLVAAVAVLAFASLASPAAAAACRCQKNYSPYGAPRAWSGQMYWECVRKPGTYKRGQHPAPLPCNGQSQLGPA